jgi:hypothetical protein
MARFREVLREVEQQPIAEAADGDIEAAANRIYRRRLVEASEAIDTLGTISLEIAVPRGPTASSWRNSLGLLAKAEDA